MSPPFGYTTSQAELTLFGCPLVARSPAGLVISLDSTTDIARDMLSTSAGMRDGVVQLMPIADGVNRSSPLGTLLAELRGENTASSNDSILMGGPPTYCF